MHRDNITGLTRGNYAAAMIALKVVGFFILGAVLGSSKTPYGPSPYSNPLILVLALCLSGSMCAVSLQRSKNAGGKGKFTSFLMLGYWCFPPVWLASIYLMCVPTVRSDSKLSADIVSDDEFYEKRSL